jgi:pimeloyl-ACP methyl ester carboxylesterase
MIRKIIASASAVLLVMFLAAFPAAHAGHKSGEQGFQNKALPIVFVHGATGSAAQYETQALRWASNNYPNVVTGIDRTSSVSATLNPMLDGFFDAVMAETGDNQIYVVAHSLGVALMNNYLNSSPERSARVAKYIGIDSQSAGVVPICPGTPDPVPCMGLYRDVNSGLQLGSNNVYFPDYGHTQMVTSAESFVEQYKFFTGEEPATTLVLPEPPGQVKIAGRALNYPANTGIEGATLQLWEVNSATGARKSSTPDAEVILDATGNFGPYRVNGQQRYEITVIRQSDTGPNQQHFYYESFMRSNYLLRLNISPLDSTLAQAIKANTGPHTGVSVVRMKEWWGDNPVNPDNVDTLYITTTTPSALVEAGNVVTGGTAPHSALTIAMIMFDIGNDGITHTDALVNLGPFLSGIDVYMPAPADPPNGKITFASQQRGTDYPQVINTPNWSMEDNHFMQVIFRDYAQAINTWGECKSARTSPCK